MKVFYIIFGVLVLTGCSQKRTKNLLPTLSSLNSQAQSEVLRSKQTRGYASAQTKSLGIMTTEELNIRKIEVTKVFKQNQKIMLVGEVKLSTRTNDFFTKVIFPYENGGEVFKKLVLTLIKASPELRASSVASKTPARFSLL
jgi:hypothetical protein